MRAKDHKGALIPSMGTGVRQKFPLSFLTEQEGQGTMRSRILLFGLGVLTGALLFGGAAAAAAGLTAEPSHHKFFVDGEEISLTAYNIAGSNYVRLRDVGEAVGFNVYWQGGVRIESGTPYTGQPAESALPEEEIPESQVPMSAAPAVSAICQEMIDLTNGLRTDCGLPALTVDPKLMEAAQVRAEEMAATSVYSHTRPDGTRRTTATDSPYTTENIHCITASRMRDPFQELAGLAVNEWAASQDHLEGMLDPTRGSIGVGVARGINAATGKECWYCVQWFLREGCQVTWVDEPILKK